MESSTRNDRNVQIGLILVILGGLALLSNFGFFRGVHDVVGALLFAFLGGLALRHYQRRRRSASLVGAFALFGLAAATITGALSGFFFLGLIGAGFLALYLADRQRWWAIIPAGTLFSLAVVAGLDQLAPRYESGSVLFIGLAATFLVLYRLPEEPKRWAIYPAVVSLVLAVLGLSIGGSWVLPLALVGVGVYLLYRRSENGHSENGHEVTAANGGSDQAPGTVSQPGPAIEGTAVAEGPDTAPETGGSGVGGSDVSGGDVSEGSISAGDVGGEGSGGSGPGEARDETGGAGDGGEERRD